MTIRPARPGDAQTLCDIVNPIIRDTTITFTTVEKTPETVREALNASRTRHLVWEKDSGVRAWASYGPFRSGPGYAQCCEHSIYVAPQAQRAGIARALMLALMDQARADGIHVMVGALSGANARAIAFHRALGFEQVGLMPQVGVKFGERQDLVLMQNSLTKG